jgi:hypothetical protein
MSDNSKPLIYPDWRRDKYDRAEDAAYTFGYHLIEHCRKEAIDDLPADLTEEQHTKCISSIDTALHNVLDLFEGFYRLDSGPDHRVEYALQVVITDNEHKEVERQEITGLDMPIGYWKWALDNEFR